MAKNKRAVKKGRRQERKEARQREQRMRWMRIGGLVILGVIALGAFSFFRASSAPQVDAPEEVMAANIDGPVDAPVSIVEFGDFGCPSCRAWHNSGIKEALKEEFGEQISFTFRHFPVITALSPTAAQAGQCAAEQGRFWDYHDYIYEVTPYQALAVDDLKGYSATIGLDSAQFDECLDSGKYRGYVSRDQQAAIAAGARGTPTFFINGQQADFSFEGMAATIQSELSSS
jgi:protein-disulfide isomerase